MTRKTLHLTILPREMAQRIANIMGHSSACARALRVLEDMRDDADKFEICQDGRGTILLMEKKFLYEPTTTPKAGNGEGA